MKTVIILFLFSFVFPIHLIARNLSIRADDLIKSTRLNERRKRRDRRSIGLSTSDLDRIEPINPGFQPIQPEQSQSFAQFLQRSRRSIIVRGSNPPEEREREREIVAHRTNFLFLILIRPRWSIGVCVKRPNDAPETADFDAGGRTPV